MPFGIVRVIVDMSIKSFRVTANVSTSNYILHPMYFLDFWIQFLDMRFHLFVKFHDIRVYRVMQSLGNIIILLNTNSMNV